MFTSPLFPIVITLLLVVYSFTYVPLLARTKFFKGSKNRLWYLVGVFSIGIGVGTDLVYHLLVNFLGVETLIVFGVTLSGPLHLFIGVMLMLGVFVRVTKGQEFKREFEKPML